MKSKAKQGSKQEDFRLDALKLLEIVKQISNLEHQPETLTVSINNIEVFKYTPDFKYYDNLTNAWVYEEYKGYMRERHDSLLRMKCASAQYPEEFRLYEGQGKKARLTRVYLNGKAVRQKKVKK